MVTFFWCIAQSSIYFDLYNVNCFTKTKVNTKISWKLKRSCFYQNAEWAMGLYWLASTDRNTKLYRVIFLISAKKCFTVFSKMCSNKSRASLRQENQYGSHNNACLQIIITYINSKPGAKCFSFFMLHLHDLILTFFPWIVKSNFLNQLTLVWLQWLIEKWCRCFRSVIFTTFTWKYNVSLMWSST